MRRKYFTDKIGSFPTAKWRGELTIPVDVVERSGGRPEEMYARGLAVAYYVAGYDRLRPGFPPWQETKILDKDTILKIMEELSKESAR